jgi:hypothetical protein
MIAAAATNTAASNADGIVVCFIILMFVIVYPNLSKRNQRGS